MDNELYDYSPIVSRPPLHFPNGAGLAFYIGLNIEHFYIDVPNSGREGRVPDPGVYGGRDYGTRVGIWRLMELFDELGVRPSAIVNSDVCIQYPQIIDAGIERDWAWIAHGKSNSVRQAGMQLDEERQFLAEMVETLDSSLPTRPKGWLGPGLFETFETPKLLRDFGFNYLLDWRCDDQPFPLRVPGMISIPYTLPVNDMSMFTSSTLPGSDYEQIVLDQFEQLLAESVITARVMALPIHTFIVGQPYRFKYFARVLRKIVATDRVWVCTSDEIADWYFANCYDPNS